MTMNVNPRVFADPRQVPTLVLVDLQKEHLASPRALAIPEVDAPLANCRSVLARARALGLPIAFVRWEGRSALFNRATPFAGWIDGFAPTGSDMVFERDRPSCYSSALFAEVMDFSGGNIVLAGFSGEAACLSTAIDAFHRGHRITYLADASASHGLNGLPAREVHRVVTEIAALYVDVVSTQSWVADLASGIGSGRAVWMPE